MPKYAATGINNTNNIILKTNLKKDYINQELTSKYENIEQMSIFKTVKLLLLSCIN